MRTALVLESFFDAVIALTRKNSLHTSERNNRDPVLLSSFKDRWLTLADVFESIATEFVEDNVTIAWRRAGECFRQAGDHKSAARCYETIRDFDNAVVSFRSAGAFDSITRLLLEHEAQLTSTLRDMLDITRFEYLRTNQYTVALTLFSNNPAEMVSCTFTRNLDSEGCSFAFQTSRATTSWQSLLIYTNHWETIAKSLSYETKKVLGRRLPTHTPKCRIINAVWSAESH